MNEVMLEVVDVYTLNMKVAVAKSRHTDSVKKMKAETKQDCRARPLRCIAPLSTNLRQPGLRVACGDGSPCREQGAAAVCNGDRCTGVCSGSLRLFPRVRVIVRVQHDCTEPIWCPPRAMLFGQPWTARALLQKPAPSRNDVLALLARTRCETAAAVARRRRQTPFARALAPVKW